MFSKIFVDIRKSRCATNINDTGCMNSTGGKFATGVNDTSSKFATSVVDAASLFDTGGNNIRMLIPYSELEEKIYLLPKGVQTKYLKLFW